eukprot:1329841-Heterocapsa_arctica.AAC.1
MLLGGLGEVVDPSGVAEGGDVQKRAVPLQGGPHEPSHVEPSGFWVDSGRPSEVLLVLHGEALGGHRAY